MSRSAAMAFGSAWGAEGILRMALYVLMAAFCVCARGEFSAAPRPRARCGRSLPRGSRSRLRSTGGNRATGRRRVPATTATPTLSSRYITTSPSFGQQLAFGRGPADEAGAVDVEVEGAVRRAATQAGNRIDPRQRGVAPLLVDRHALGDEALVAVQRGGGRGLADRAAVAGGLRQQRVQRLHQVARARRPSRCASRSSRRSWTRR